MQLSALLSGLLIGNACLLNGIVQAEDWTRFRGPNGTGISQAKGIPISWGEKSYKWNVELPGIGHSSPVIKGERLFVTSATQPQNVDDGGQLRHLICLNANTGEQNWIRTVGFNTSHRHSKNSYASSTPAVDDERVYVAFADQERHTLAAYDFEGNLVWRKNLGPFESQHGQGVSPIVYNGLVILAKDMKGPSVISAYDAKTGELRWSTLRTHRRTSYATPMILERDGKETQLICLSGAMGLTSLDPNTGKLNWMSGELEARTVASPVYGGGVLIGMCGGGGRGKFLVAVDPSGQGDVSKTHVKYTRDKILPYVPTPIAYKDHLYLWNDNGVVSCLEMATGKNIWTKRVGGGFSGSPVCIDGKLYCISEDGDVVIIAASPEYALLNTIPLGDRSHSTPAVASGNLYLRTFSRLMCVPGTE